MNNPVVGMNLFEDASMVLVEDMLYLMMTIVRDLNLARKRRDKGERCRHDSGYR